MKIFTLFVLKLAKHVKNDFSANIFNLLLSEEPNNLRVCVFVKVN